MEKVVSAMMVRDRLGELLEGSFYQGNEYIIERNKKRVAALIPIQEFMVLRQIKRKSWDVVERLWARNAKVDPLRLEKDIEEAIKEVRARNVAGSD